MNKRVVVIGYGNPLRTDDRFGLEVADRLKHAVGDSPHLAVHSTQQLLPEHIDWVKDTSWLLLIDASYEQPTGELCIRRVFRAPPHNTAAAHHLSADALVGLADAMGIKPPHVLLITAGGRSFEAGEAMTPALVALADRTADGILTRLTHHRT
ncbi:hydrogenase maturation protease [candidate division GN15 bacterium]|nr:hydrogenase maturation protease [candidate division GN15 bacterium]